jgi:tetratricopeptide (TPR) repeat protein
VTQIRTQLSRGAAVVVVLGLLAGGCASDEEKLQTHLARAESYIEKGDDKAALVELRGALQLAPKNGAVNLRLAEVMSRQGKANEAVFFFEEAIRLDPTLDAARIGLAQYLATGDPARSEKLLNEVLAHDASNATAQAAMANLYLLRRDPEQALKAALVAVNLAPDDPQIQLQLGRVYQAKIQVQQSNGKVADDATFQGAVGAFEAAGKAAGGDVYTQTSASFERARVLAAWPNHVPEAQKAYLELIDRVKDSTDAKLVESVRSVALRFAAITGDKEVFKTIIEKVLATDPSYLPAWVKLAAFEETQGRSADAVYDRLIEQQSGNAEAYVVRADYLQRRGKSEEALAVLQGALDKVDKPQTVRSALVDVNYRLGRADDAVKIVDEMQKDSPGDPETQIAAATRAFREQRFKEGAEILTPLSTTSEQPKVFRMLAEARLRSGDLEAATRAIDRGIELAGPGWIVGLNLRFQIQRASGDFQGALKTLGDLQQQGAPLTDDQYVMAAEALYETGQSQRGRQILEHVLAKPEAPDIARIAFARREGTSNPDRARKLLDEALKRAPNDRSLIQELAILDALKGDTRAAMARLDGLLDTLPPGDAAPTLRILRGRLRAQTGDIAGGEEDAAAAFRAAPNAQGAADLVATIATMRKRVPEAIALFEEVDKTGALSSAGRGVLGRLYIAADRDDDALRILEEQLAKNNDALTKNDVAYLLAKQGRDLERALVLAQEAVASADNSPNFADTLGYVYLQKSLYEPALVQFDRAIELAQQAGQPRPAFHYRRGLALEKLERREEAMRAFDAALSIDPGFADAQKARSALEAAGGGTPKQSS